MGALWALALPFTQDQRTVGVGNGPTCESVKFVVESVDVGWQMFQSQKCADLEDYMGKAQCGLVQGNASGHPSEVAKYQPGRRRRGRR